MYQGEDNSDYLEELRHSKLVLTAVTACVWIRTRVIVALRLMATISVAWWRTRHD